MNDESGFYINSDLGFNDQYDLYLSSRYSQFLSKILTEERGGVSSPPVRILDAGCKYASLKSILDPEKFEYVGVDRDSDALALAGKYNPGVEVAICDLCQGIPERLGSFDFIVCSLVLGLLDEPAQAIRNMLGRLRDRGTLIIVDLLQGGEDCFEGNSGLTTDYVLSQYSLSYTLGQVRTLISEAVADGKTCHWELSQLYDDGEYFPGEAGWPVVFCKIVSE